MKNGNPQLMREEADRYWECFRDELDMALPYSNLTRRIFNKLLEQGQGKMNDLIDLYEASRMLPGEEVAPSIKSRLP